MKVLGLCSYPLEAACSRYRLMQFVKPLAEKKIDLTIKPFIDKDTFASLYQKGQSSRKIINLFSSAVKRLDALFYARQFDAILIQREAMLFGPPLFEWLYKKISKSPLILDLDDATYLSQNNPNYGRLVNKIKFFGKTDKLIDWSQTVICGNRFIAEYVEGRGKATVIMPTVVDTDKFCPAISDEIKPLTIGWIGTHSTFPFLESLFPVFSELGKKYDFILKIVGAGMDNIKIENVNVVNSEWSLEREIKDFQSLDIGLYPLQTTESVDEKWLQGKSGFKAIQYLSVGIPYIVTPIGVTKEIGIDKETHFTAINPDQWYSNIENLIINRDLRKRIGINGRNYALKHYNLNQQAEVLAQTIKGAYEKFNTNK